MAMIAVSWSELQTFAVGAQAPSLSGHDEDLLCSSFLSHMVPFAGFSVFETLMKELSVLLCQLN